MDSSLTIRIGIVSHNRADILPKAIESALAQDWPDKEVWVIDDASSDHTDELREKYPQVRWTREEHSIGYREARNRMMREPGAAFFASLDDDSWFLENDALSQAMERFSSRPRLAAIGFQILDSSMPERSGRGPERPAHTFIGCGHLLRLEAVLQVGCYAEVPGTYGGEEKDLSLALVDAGWDVVELPGVHVWHDKTMQARDVARQHRSGVSNDLSSALRRCPLPHVLWVLPGKILRHLAFCFKFALTRHPVDDFNRNVREQIGSWGFFLPTFWGLLDYLVHLPGLLQHREAVECETWSEVLRRSRQPRPPYPLRVPETVSVSITTRNRWPDLNHTLARLGELTPGPVEILVCADDCTDETVPMVKERFPAVRLLVNAVWQGSIPSRDRILREAKGDLVLSLDDDSYPMEKDALARMLGLFEKQPGVAVFTFPQITDEFPESFTQIKAQRGERAMVGSFTNSGAAIRRELYQKLPGYPVFFHHAYEEPDFALQCIAAGYGVAVDPGVTIRHHYSRVARNEIRTHHLHARNEMWSVWMRCPWVMLPAVSLFRVARQFLYAGGRGISWVAREPMWWWDCFKGGIVCWRQRRPVGLRAYWRWLWRVRRPEGF